MAPILFAWFETKDDNPIYPMNFLRTFIISNVIFLSRQESLSYNLRQTLVPWPCVLFVSCTQTGLNSDWTLCSLSLSLSNMRLKNGNHCTKESPPQSPTPCHCYPHRFSVSCFWLCARLQTIPRIILILGQVLYYLEHGGEYTRLCSTLNGWP